MPGYTGMAVLPYSGEGTRSVEGGFLNIAIFTDSYKPYVSGVVNSINTFNRELRRSAHLLCICSRLRDVMMSDIPVCSIKHHQPDFPAVPLSLSVVKRSQSEGDDHTHSPVLGDWPLCTAWACH